MTGIYTPSLARSVKRALDEMRIDFPMGDGGSLYERSMARALVASVRPRGAAKGSYGRRLLRSVIRDGRRWELHATKGWMKRERV